MKVKVNKNRQVFGGSLKVGITNENNYEVLEFTFPQELDNYIKYIEIEAENEEGKLEYVDRIENNKFTLSNRLTKYSELTMEVSCRDLNGIVFKSEIFTVTIGQALNILEDLVQEQEDLFERVERELQEVYQGMEDFKTEIVEDANSRFNTNVTEKTQGFNTNAETKTTDFNNNYDTKLNAFNSNYDEKLDTFNTNATSKLTEYNNNDTAKTEAYNTNATEKLSTYNTNATNKLAEYNTNAETKLNAYNTNATQKLAEYDSLVEELHEDLDETQAKVEQYNTNIDTKYTQYNTNAEQKLSAYNENATTKTNAYNTNAQTKLEAYNTNATTKTTAYNENAEEKLEEYNENASALIQSVDTLEQKHDTEVAELNEKIADLQEEVDMASDLIPTAPATGSDITVNDSARYYFKKFEVGGKSDQESYRGTNLCDLNVTQNSKVTYNEDGTLTINGSGDFNINFKTLTLKANETYYSRWEVVSGTATGAIFGINGEQQAQNTWASVTPSNDMNKSNFYVHANATFTNAKIRLWISKSQSEFEKYVGGQPAPNPSYECPIQNVTGDVEVEVEGRNLFDEEWLSLGRRYAADNATNFATQTEANNTGCLNPIKLNKRFNYINISSNSNYRLNGIYFYNKNKKYISRDFQALNTTFAIPENAYYMTFNVQGVNALSDLEQYNWQVEYKLSSSDTPLSYMPYEEEQTAIFPLEEGQVLHEGDTIEDKIVQKRGTFSVSISSIDTLPNGNKVGIFNATNKLHTIKQNALCSKATKGSYSEGKSGTFYENPTNFIFIGDSTDTLQTLREKYNGAQIEYELATPIETEFTEAQATAKAQIDKLYSYKGTTYITSEANLNVIYRKDPSLAEEQQNSKLEELEARIALLEE